MADMSRADAHTALGSVTAAMTVQHADQQDRLVQLTGALETAGMAVDYLFDQAENNAAEGQ
jgi:hypothetical protein